MNRPLIATASAAFLAAGGWLIWSSLPNEAPAAPMPSSVVSAAVDVPTAGATAGELAPESGAGTGSMSPDGMEADRLYIPELGIYSPLEQHGVEDGLLVLDPDPTRLTLFSGGAKLGQSSGTVLISGHVSNGEKLGSLYHLSTLQAGHLAYVTDAAGNREAFKLVHLEGYRKADLPEEVWATDGERRLVVVTCGGDIVTTASGRRVFEDNIVATFVPVGG